MLQDQARHIMEVIQHAKRSESRIIEPSPEAQAQWCETIERTESKSRDFQLECTPGYYNNEGQLDKGPGFVGGLYGGGPIEFQKIVDEWLSDGGMKGLKFS
jgi:cyclohexanone monooxygenase